MKKRNEGLIKFVINGFLALGLIMVFYLMLYAFFYDSRKYILNLYMIIQDLFIKCGLNLTNNFYVNLGVVYLVVLVVLYILGDYILELGKKDNGKDRDTNFKLPKHVKMLKSKGKIRKK